MSEENNVVETVKISKQMLQDFVEEIIKLEQDNLYVNRANLKEKIVVIAKTKVR